MSSITPGPWRIEKSGPKDVTVYVGGESQQWRVCEVSGVVATRPDGTIKRVAHVNHGTLLWSDEGLAVQEANARLIAAAPDLLLACKGADELLGLIRQSEGLVRHRALLAVPATLRQVRAAIAKAKGESE